MAGSVFLMLAADSRYNQAMGCWCVMAADSSPCINDPQLATAANSDDSINGIFPNSQLSQSMYFGIFWGQYRDSRTTLQKSGGSSGDNPV